MPPPTEPSPQLPEIELDVRVSSDGLRHDIVFSDRRPAIFLEIDPAGRAHPENPAEGSK